MTTNPLHQFAKTASTSEEHIPRIQSIHDVFVKFPHMQSDPVTGVPNCSLAVDKFLSDSKQDGNHITTKPKKKAGAVVKPENPPLPTSIVPDSFWDNQTQIEERHVEQSQTTPWQIAVFLETLKRVQPPVWYFSDPYSSMAETMNMNRIDQGTFNSLLRKGVIDLPIMSEMLESDLLAEAGTYTVGDLAGVYDFPPCFNGSNCIGCSPDMVNHMKGLTRPIILTQVMFLSEYTDFLQRNVNASRIPNRPCILCVRYTMADLITLMRANRSTSTAETAPYVDSNFQYESTQVLQLYRNIPNQPDGYAKEFMLYPEPGEAIIEPIVMLNRSKLECKLDPNGRRFIDQSALAYQSSKMPKPRVGENLESFSKGANKN